MTPSLRGIIDQNADRILEAWVQEAQKAVASEGLSRTELVNRLPAFLASLLRHPDADDAARVSQRWLIDSHLAARLREGFELPEMVEEFQLLGRCIEAIWAGSPEAERPPPVEIKQMHEELRRATSAAMALFGENLIQYQQSEKQYLRRMRKIAAEAVAEDAQVPLENRLHDILAVIAAALKAETTGLYFYEPLDQQMHLVASTGSDGDLMLEYVTPPGAPSFASRLIESDRGIYVPDVTGFEVPEPIRKTGARSILGMPLLAHGVRLGALYAGVRETRLFEPREVRMFESLGEQLGQLLDEARVHSKLKATNQQLRLERELRERFVAVLAHDLLGPLAAARMGTQLLLSHPELLSERSTVFTRITQDLDRTDRMVRDLLDVHQIRAGHRLTLRIGKSDLVAIVNEVVQELTLIHGPRFTVTAGEHLWGFWSSRDLRRAIWNLASNAIKYGTSTTPVDIRIGLAGDQVSIAVHNQGAPIPPGDRATLFDAFSRANPGAAEAQRGWGLGLTLVKGCAEAHGGTITIESEAETGTVFTLGLPLDARPAQAPAVA